MSHNQSSWRENVLVIGGSLLGVAFVAMVVYGGINILIDVGRAIVHK